MNRQEIQQLLDAFLDGMTTVEQEQRLAEYFRSASEVPSEWEPFRRMFGWFDSGMQESLAPIPTKRKLIYRIAPIVSAAASVAILIGVFMNMPEPTPQLHSAASQKTPIRKSPLRVNTAQTSNVASPKEKSATPHVASTRDAMKSSDKAIADAERIYNEQNHDMVDERYENVRQAVSTQEVRSRGFFTAVDEQGNVQIIRCTNENTNQSNLVEL